MMKAKGAALLPIKIMVGIVMGSPISATKTYWVPHIFAFHIV